MAKIKLLDVFREVLDALEIDSSVARTEDVVKFSASVKTPKTLVIRYVLGEGDLPISVSDKVDDYLYIEKDFSDVIEEKIDDELPFFVQDGNIEFKFSYSAGKLHLSGEVSGWYDLEADIENYHMCNDYDQEKDDAMEGC